jgi:hypothetical protein
MEWKIHGPVLLKKHETSWWVKICANLLLFNPVIDKLAPVLSGNLFQIFQLSIDRVPPDRIWVYCFGKKHHSKQPPWLNLT